MTSGASSDFQQATRLAKAMVTQWGFSSKLGIQYNGDPKDKLSGETQALIDNEVRDLLNDSYIRATTLINNHKRELRYIAHALIEHETLSGSEIRDVAGGYKINIRKRSQEPSRKPIVLPTPKPATVIKPTKPSAAPVSVSASAPTPSTVITQTQHGKGNAKAKDSNSGSGSEGKQAIKEEKSSSNKQARGPPPL